MARWSAEQHQTGPVTIAAYGPRASLYSLVAAALDKKSVVDAELHDSFGSLKEILEQDRNVAEAPELFTFGLLKDFDIRTLTALVAPRPVVFIAASERVRKEMTGLKEFYKLLGTDFEPTP